MLVERGKESGNGKYVTAYVMIPVVGVGAPALRARFLQS